jgi:hypothetical protein
MSVLRAVKGAHNLPPPGGGCPLNPIGPIYLGESNDYDGE